MKPRDNMVSFELSGMVTLPWPDHRLNPNFKRSNSHWVYGPVAAKAKEEAWALCCSAIPQEVRKRIIDVPGRIYMTVAFFPPDKRWRDDDNMIGAFKHARDGIAAALGVDDRLFRPHYFFEDPCKPGRVEVNFSPTNFEQNVTRGAHAVVTQSGPKQRDNAATGLTHNRLVEGGAHGSAIK